MLAIDNLSLKYGASQALRSVSSRGARRRGHLRAGPERRRQDVAAAGAFGPASRSRPEASGSTDRTSRRLKPFERAALGVAYVPQGREIFPFLTVKENLETAFAPLKRGTRTIPDEVFELFPILGSMLGRRGGDLSGGQQQQLAIGRALVMRPRLLLLDEPTEGIQPSIIKDIGRAISYLRGRKDMAIILVEQYFDFARELADRFVIMERGAIVHQGDRAALAGDDVRQRLAI